MDRMTGNAMHQKLNWAWNSLIKLWTQSTYCFMCLIGAVIRKISVFCSKGQDKIEK